MSVPMQADGWEATLHCQYRPEAEWLSAQGEPPPSSLLCFHPVSFPTTHPGGITWCLSSGTPFLLSFSAAKGPPLYSSLLSAFRLHWALASDGLQTFVLQAIPPLTELPSGLLKIKSFLASHGVSTLSSVVCPALDSSLLCTTSLGHPLSSASKRAWQSHQHTH